MRQKVIVVGGGVAGLTAAHELIDRDFDVVVYERREYLGGKAASSLKASRGGPTEHGFRFFPAWYRHLPDTLKRIPYRGRRQYYELATVYDNLVEVGASLVAQYGREPIRALLHLPRSVADVETLVAFARDLQRLDLPREEAVFFFQKLSEFLRTPKDQRIKKYENVSWWQFLDADNKSNAFRALIAATTQSLVAAKPRTASAYTIARIAIRTLTDALASVDRVLNGPTSSVWIEPWRTYLKSRGVQFRMGQELLRIEFKDSSPRVSGLVFQSVHAQLERQVLRDSYTATRIFQSALIAADAPGGDIGVLRDPFTRWQRSIVDSTSVVKKVPQRSTAHRLVQKLSQCAEVQLEPRDDLKASINECLHELEVSLSSVQPDAATSINADWYVFALPVEQMAYYINRSPMMTQHDPSLANMIQLSESVDWMSGIQFFLREPLDIDAGHIVCIDTEWSLTAIEQSRFWRDTELPVDTKSVLSVDISSWDRKGRLQQKEAFNCSREEIAKEVWEQLSQTLNRAGRPRVLREEMLINQKVEGSFSLDASIIDRSDRRKQGAYEKARSVRFSAEALLERRRNGPGAGETPYVVPDGLQANAEPLLINRIGTNRLRPQARTKISNVFLASDYVATNTDLACMEAANEAARRAVNAILDASSASQEPCEIWDFVDSASAQDLLSLVGLAQEMIASPIEVTLSASRGLARNFISRVAKTVYRIGK